MNTKTTLIGGHTTGVSRRSFAKASAWSVPVLASATAAPAFAASQPHEETPVKKTARLTFYTSRTEWIWTNVVTGIKTVIQAANLWNNASGGVSSTVNDLVVSVTYAAGLIPANVAPTIVAGTGWTYVGRIGDTFTFRFSPTLGPSENTGNGSNGRHEFAYSLPIVKAISGAVVSYTATASNADPVTATSTT